VASGGTVELSNPQAGSIELKGTYAATGGTLFLAQDVEGTGTLQINAAATLEIGSTVADTEQITFAGKGATLRIDAPGSVNANLTNFGVGDKLDLIGVTATGVTYSGNNITINSGSGSYTYSSTLTLQGDKAKIVSDGHGGSLITVIAPSTLGLSAMAFIPATGGAERVLGNSADLNHANVAGWAAGDLIKVTGIAFASAHESHTGGTGAGAQWLDDGHHSPAIGVGGGFAPHTFVPSAGSNGVMVAYHS
jgi:hypothetical protein